MADKFDPYREALIMETATVWPSEFNDIAPAEKARVEAILHSMPDRAAQIEYVRVHTGFCRTIHVTQADLDRALQAR
jgi:hypothetical protein